MDTPSNDDGGRDDFARPFQAARAQLHQPVGTIAAPEASEAQQLLLSDETSSELETAGRGRTTTTAPACRCMGQPQPPSHSQAWSSWQKCMFALALCSVLLASIKMLQ